MELLGVGIALKLRAALFLLHPQHGVDGVAVDNLVGYALLVHECKSMDDGKKLTDVVGAVHGTEMEHLGTGSEVYAAILHRSGVA